MFKTQKRQVWTIVTLRLIYVSKYQIFLSFSGLSEEAVSLIYNP